MSSSRPTPPPSQLNAYPRVLLFDIGGVCVVSPMQAILDYEKSHNIPVGWVNLSISLSGVQGAWQKLERGDILLDHAFFTQFHADLSDEKRWREYHARRKIDPVPPVPAIDAEELYWRMMSISRSPDPHMWPALQRLRAAADASGGKLILAALSNTAIFPPNHPFNDETTPEGRQNKALKSVFEIFVSSAHVGMRKPEDGIYKYAVTRLHEYVKLNGYGMGVRPQDITFLDDIGTNLRTGRMLGFNTIKVQLGKTDKAVEELERITGLSLREDKARL